MRNLDKYIFLKEYLFGETNSRQKIKESLALVRESKIEENEVHDSPEIIKTRLKLQSELIAFLEIDEQDIKSQIKALSLIKKSLWKTNDSQEFTRDIEVLIRRLANSRVKQKAENREGFKLMFTQDPFILFRSGEVPGSCQRLDGDPTLNKCLLNIMMDPKIKSIVILDKYGNLQARALLRLMQNEKTLENLLFLEEIYPWFISEDLEQAIIKFASLLAEDMELPLLRSVSEENREIYPDPIISRGSFSPEYVDAVHKIVENGEYTIQNSEIHCYPWNADRLLALRKTLTEFIPNHFNTTILEYSGLDIKRVSLDPNDKINKVLTPGKKLYFKYKSCLSSLSDKVIEEIPSHSPITGLK